MARKGKYHYWLTDEGLMLIEGWARDGLTENQIAYNMGISVSSLAEWKNRFPKLLESLKKTKEVVDRQVENALFQKALSGDTTAMIFWLKNRKYMTWRDRKDLEAKVDAKVEKANPYENLTEEELLRLVKNDG